MFETPRLAHVVVQNHNSRTKNFRAFCSVSRVENCSGFHNKLCVDFRASWEELKQKNSLRVREHVLNGFSGRYNLFGGPLLSTGHIKTLCPVTSATVWVALKSESRTRYVEFHNHKYKFFTSRLYFFIAKRYLLSGCIKI
jgi:hypothetical protein